MAALPYMQLYVADYLADTAHLTTEEHGAYLLLLFSYWQTGKPLREDRLASVARLSNERWADVERTLKEFFHVAKGAWTHFRVEADLEKVDSKSKKNSDAGKASAKARALAKQALEESDSTNVATNVDTNVQRTHQRNVNHTRSGDTDTETNTEAKQDQYQERLSALSEPKQKRKARLPDQFLVTGAMRQWAAESVPAVELKTETENFCDYWRGQGGTKLDWVATWRTWMRKAQKDSQRGGGRGFTPFNKAADVEASNQAVVEEIIRRQAERTGKPSAQPGELVASADGTLIIEGDFFNAS